MKLSSIPLFLVIFFAILFLLGPILIWAAGGTSFIDIQNPLEQDTIEGIITSITGILKGIAISIGAVMIVWGGIQIMTGYMTGEKEHKVMQGKKTITWTVIGVAIVILVDFIVGIVKEMLEVK